MYFIYVFGRNKNKKTLSFIINLHNYLCDYPVHLYKKIIEIITSKIQLLILRCNKSKY